MTENLPEKRRTQVTLNAPLTDLDQAWRLCEALAGSTLVPRALQGKPANILLVIMTGQELGLSAAQSLRTIYAPSSGNTQLRGQLVLAQLRKAGHDWQIEQDEEQCTFTLIRGDNQREYKGTFSMKDALRARLVEQRQDEHGDTIYLARSSEGKILPWELYSSDMLFWRAVSRAVNRGAPEVMLGFGIMGASEATEPEPEPVQLSPQISPPPNPETAANAGAAAGSAGPALGEASGPAPSEVSDHLRRELQELSRAAGPARPGIPSEEIEPVGDRPPEAGADGNDIPDGGPAADLQIPPEETQGELLEAAPAPPAAPAPGAAATPVKEGKGDPGHRQQLAALTRRFTTIGWEPKTHREQVLRTCSAYTRRTIASASDMTTTEALSLNTTLAQIIRKHDPDTYPVILNEAVESWEYAAQQERQ
jgi:hypothetical protein